MLVNPFLKTFLTQNDLQKVKLLKSLDISFFLSFSNLRLIKIFLYFFHKMHKRGRKDEIFLYIYISQACIIIAHNEVFALYYYVVPIRACVGCDLQRKKQIFVISACVRFCIRRNNGSRGRISLIQENPLCRPRRARASRNTCRRIRLPCKTHSFRNLLGVLFRILKSP